ncbi:MAG: tetratricopeptide repeat protein [Deltaproteobacteria bacterium]|nr:tetratricopeptide repeat protein [Deltaproteobacteria bacterium]
MDLAWVALALAATSAPLDEDTDDQPLVSILESTGRIDGASGVSPPVWDRVRVELRVKNALPVDVDTLSVEIALVATTSGEGEEEPIPGWRLEQTFDEVVLAAGQETALRVERSLPARRRTQPATEIAYRVRVTGYRLLPPSLDLGTRLLESSAPGDQRAALMSYERLRDPGLPPGTAEIALRELAKAIANPPKDAEPTSALRLLLALRAAGDVDHPLLIPLLLALPERVDAMRWGAALSDLAQRMLEASLPREPRLELLPTWAQSGPAVLSTQGGEVLVGAAQQAILHLGDRAVPELVRAAQLADSEQVRAQARSALRILGRGTVRSQLSIADRVARERLLEVYGEIGSGEPVAALVEILARRGSATGPELEAIKRIGSAAVPLLVDALATPDRDTRHAVVGVIGELGTECRGEISAAARRFGIAVDGRTSTSTIAERLAHHLAANARARWSGELARALGLARSGDHEEAFRLLDSVYGADPDLYMSQADAIAKAYVSRARALLANGNFDAAIEVLRVGQTIKRLPEMADVLRDAQLTLARGYLDLDELDRAEEALDGADPTGVDGEARTLRAHIITRRAALALEKGEYGRARTLIDRARTIAPDAEETQRLNRRLRLSENVPIVLVLSLMVPGGALTLVLMLRRKVERRKMQREML